MYKPKIFISSTSDLKEERNALKMGLSQFYDLYLFEEDRARKESPEEQCRKEIEASHIFVGLLGKQYGSVLPGSNPPRSIVEWEYDVATAAGPDVMMFIKELPATDSHIPEQSKFIDRVRNFRRGVWCKFFADAQGLYESVRKSLENWLIEYWARTEQSSAKIRNKIPRILVVIGIVALMLFLLLLWLAAGDHLSLSSIFEGITMIVVILFLGLVLFHMNFGGKQ